MDATTFNNPGTLQALISVCSLIVATVGIYMLRAQLKSLEKATRGDTHANLYVQCLEITKLLLANPDLKRYIFDGKEMPVKDKKYASLTIIAEIIADFFEHISLQRENLPNDVWPHWEEYMRDIYHRCPMLRRHFRLRQNWYTHHILSICSDKKHRRAYLRTFSNKSSVLKHIQNGKMLSRNT